MKNGTAVYGIVLPADFDAMVLRQANKENRLPHDVIVDLAMQGAGFEPKTCRVCGCIPIRKDNKCQGCDFCNH